MLKKTEDVKHWQWPPSGYFGSIFPYCSPVSGGGGGGFSTTPTFLNHSNIEAVPNKRQPGDSPWTTKPSQPVNDKVMGRVVQCKNTQGIAFSATELQLKAKLVARDLHITDFRASQSWTCGLLHRHQLSICRHQHFMEKYELYLM